MNNPWDEMEQALSQHRQLMRAAEHNANVMAELLTAVIREVSPYRAEKLKRALRDFNMHTGRWK